MELFPSAEEVEHRRRLEAARAAWVQERRWLMFVEGRSWRLESQDALTWELLPWPPESADDGFRYLSAVLDNIPTSVWSALPTITR
jgi:hypothetical protein